MPARAKFCMDCGARMAVDSGERRVVTVLFADLSGFTSYSETVDPEEVRRLAQEAAGSLGDIVRRYGGTVDKIIGDCVMAIYGAPVAHEDDPERAVRAALDMQRFVDENPERFANLRLTIGVHTGEAIYAPVGPSGEYTVLGDTVNTAARLQSAASRGEVLIGEPTQRAVDGAIELEDIPPIAAKNKRDPVPAWRAIQPRGEQPRRARARTPLVGRDAELGRLNELWERARTKRQPHAAVVLGAPGIGKSRLIHAVTERVAQTATVLMGRCLSYGEGITYWPIIEMIKDAAGIMHDDDTDATSRKLGTLLESLGTDDLDELRTMAVAVANLVAAPRTPRGTYAAERIERSELHWGLRRIFTLLSNQRPLVLRIEDAHWAEPALLDLAMYILDEPEARILIMVSARPELADEAPPLLEPKLNRRVIELGPLSEEQSLQLLVGLVGEEAGAAMNSLVQHAGGNPLFLEEIVQMLRDSGAIGEPGGPVGSIDDLPVPESLQALIESRLDQLPTLEKGVLGHAAIVGAAFWSGSLAHLEGTDPERLRPALAGLQDRDIIRAATTTSIADEDEYRFTHLLLRDVAYGRIPKAQRAELHRRCGEWISRIPGQTDEYIEFVAFHLERACRLIAEVGARDEDPPILEAVDALRRSAERAERRQGVHEADRFYARALEILGEGLPETAAELSLRRTRTRTVLGDLDSAEESLRRIAADAGALGRPDLRGTALIELSDILYRRGGADEARAHLAEAEAVAEALGDLRLRTLTAYLSSGLNQLAGDMETAGDDIRRGIGFAQELGEPELAASGHLRLGAILVNSGKLEEAERAIEPARAIAEEIGNLRIRAISTSILGFIRTYRGPRDEAERLLRQAVTWFERTPDVQMTVQSFRTLALLAHIQGRYEKAERQIRRALPLAVGRGTLLAAELYRNVIPSLLRQGKTDEARHALDEARAAAPDGHPYAQAEVLFSEAYLAAADRDLDAVHGGFGAVIEAMERFGRHVYLADARAAYARALASLGETQAARAQFEAARKTYTSIGADAMVADVDAAVAALEARSARGA